MKKNHLFFYSLVFIFLACCTGCKKYLAVKSDNSLVIPSTLNDLQALLDDASTMNYNTPGFGGASADEYFTDQDSYNSFTVFNQQVYTWIKYPYKYPNDWGLAYGAIYNANLCLERVVNIQPMPNELLEWNNVKGSAFFYRAYYFAELSWLFAKVYDAATAETDKGIVLRLGTDFNKASVRSSTKVSYEQVIADAKAAALYLPPAPQQTTRPSKAAAYGLLARVYLSMRQYDSAGRYADLALQIKHSLMDYNNPAQVDGTGYYPFKRINEETIFYTTMNYYLALSHPLMSNAMVDTVLYGSYDSNDLRKTIFFSEAGNYKKFKGNYAADFALFSGIATDELLLTRAECFVRNNQSQKALEDMNVLLVNRYATGTFTPITVGSTLTLLQTILNERKKELLFRGSLRWVDVKRLNKENAGIELKRRISNQTFSLPPNDNRYALQIPEDIIENSGIAQN